MATRAAGGEEAEAAAEAAAAAAAAAVAMAVTTTGERAAPFWWRMAQRRRGGKWTNDTTIGPAVCPCIHLSCHLCGCLLLFRPRFLENAPLTLTYFSLRF